MKRPNKIKALERLKKALEGASEVLYEQIDSPLFEKWHRNTIVAISNTFGDNSGNVSEFRSVSFSPPISFGVISDSQYQRAFENGMASATSLLESMMEEIEEYWDEDIPPVAKSDSDIQPSKISNKVFVIHGHNQAAREKVARFLEKLHLQPVILHEQPNEGRTIIEKFEVFSDVYFAVVLLTADDVGGRDQEARELKPRARQNVVFEFGYFIGRLGRKRVCALLDIAIEKPSDCDGILYVPLDEQDSWRLPLIQELKAAGFDIDANDAF